ncbi:MAG: N-6 DNA methylase, partial [Mariniphaga sp.]|nr:N-6 DNA methylase [Mariniphaga sp.]
MEKTFDILDELDFKEFIEPIDNLKNILHHSRRYYISTEIEGKFEIDSVYFTGDYASLYFKSITDFNPESLIDICIQQKKIWNQRKVPFLYVSSPTEIRIYNCFDTPINPYKNLEDFNQIEIGRFSISDTIEDFNKLKSLFGRIAIDSGSLWSDSEFTCHFNINKRVDKVLVSNLRNTKLKLLKRGISPEIIHDLLTRSLFIIYLEDIGATDPEFYRIFKSDANTYFDLLSEKTPTYKYFKHLEDKFNGDLFPVSQVEEEQISESDLALISSCFWGDEITYGQKSLWKKFDFKVIPIELLSEIYEIFLNKTDEEKSKNGEYYTPHSLVDLILNECLPWPNEKNKNYNLTVIDIACGSGIFLVESYRRLIERWIATYNKNPEFNDLKKILINSIYAFEINREAIKVAAFSLYLALISYLNPKTIWQRSEVKFPYLIYDSEIKENKRQGKNLYRQSSLSNIIEHQPDFDLILGNPPFKSSKTGSIDKEAGDYCKREEFAQEMVLPFIHRASKLCKKNGNVALISTSKILFNKSGGYRKFREYLFNNNFVNTVINFSALRKPKKGQGKSVFANAVGPACVIFFKNTEPKEPFEKLTYICPKPTEKDRFGDSLILDPLDFYYLPRKECEKPDTTIWKTAMWGTERDFLLIEKFSKGKTLKHYLNEKDGWVKGVGLQFLTNNSSSPKFD